MYVLKKLTISENLSLQRKKINKKHLIIHIFNSP